MREFNVGDKVIDGFGNVGTVVDVNLDPPNYYCSIKVRFDGYYREYARTGEYYWRPNCMLDIRHLDAPVTSAAEPPAAPSPKIKVGETWANKFGTTYKIVCVDAPGDRPIIGARVNEEGGTAVLSFAASGQYHSDPPFTSMDLITKVEPPFECTKWLTEDGVLWEEECVTDADTDAPYIRFDGNLHPARRVRLREVK